MSLTKYAVAKRLQISQKILRDWIAKESEIGNQRRKITTGRQTSCPELEEYLHDNLLILRTQGVKVKWVWFLAKGKKWYEEQFSERL